MEAEFLQKTLGLVVWNTGELLIFGGILVILQWWIPVNNKQNNWDKSSFIDISYSFILTLCTPLFLVIPIVIVDILISYSPTLKKIPEQLSSQWPILLQILIAIIVVDFVSYWRHRMMHLKWLWPIHAIHHCSRRLNWLSTERFHVLNYFITSTINTILVQILFGPEVTLVGAFLRRFYNLFIHANIKMDYGYLGYILVSPRFHHWHHSLNKQVRDKNYSTFFSCIDLLFGTFYLPRDGTYPMHFGEPDNIEESLAVQFYYPFKTWTRWIIRKRQ